MRLQFLQEKKPLPLQKQSIPELQNKKQLRRRLKAMIPLCLKNLKLKMNEDMPFRNGLPEASIRLSSMILILMHSDWAKNGLS
jgi:hypothetical protein